MVDQILYTAFGGDSLIAAGPIGSVLPELKRWSDAHPGQIPLTFEDHTGRQVDFDLSGTIDVVLARLPTSEPQASTGPGRPKLGVVSREVTLLPRHWEWLEEQPNGASAALRRLIDEARKEKNAQHLARLSADATCRFMSAMAGNLPGYESASRALYAHERSRFEISIESWPEAIKAYALRLSESSFLTPAP